MKLTSEIFTLDNLWHSLVAVAFVAAIGSWLPAWCLPIVAALAAIGLYLREASQVDWDFTLRWSLHKHFEWLVGSVAGVVAALVIFAVKSFVG